MPSFFYLYSGQLDFSLYKQRYCADPELIQGEKMMIQKLEYMHYNPAKRGYVDDPIHWRYSSARNYAEQEGLLEVCMEW